MTDEEIIEKAISKAIAGGWDSYIEAVEFEVLDKYNVVFRLPEHNIEVSTSDIIFNHDFLKALWGECTTWVRSAKGTVNHLPLNGWQYHAQQMVINNDQIKYLGANI